MNGCGCVEPMMFQPFARTVTPTTAVSPGPTLICSGRLIRSASSGSDALSRAVQGAEPRFLTSIRWRPRK